MKNNPALLRIPGPTPIPENIQRALSKPMINHRGPVMNELFATLKKDMKDIFGTKGQVLFLSGSGTSAMETAVTNIVSEKEQVLVLVSGNFGERFAQICEAKNLIVHKIIVPMGKVIDPTEVGYYLEKNPKIKAVFATLCETSTGVLNPIKDISAMIKETSEALFVVDGVSAVGAVDVQMDNWGIDVFVTSSQKALMLPPGLAIIAMRGDTWQKIQHNKGSQFYFDLVKYKESLDENRMPFTPPISLLYGLHESITMLKNEGHAKVYQRHQ